MNVYDIIVFVIFSLLTPTKMAPFGSESTWEKYDAVVNTFHPEIKLLCFDLLTRPKMPFKVTHRKEVTHSNGSYERKSRGWKLADEIGRGKKNPIILSEKRVISELHDSYFRSMTITQIAEVTHPDRQISEEIAEAWRRVHITAWEFEGNIRLTNWTEGVSWVEYRRVELETEIDEI